MSKKSQVCSLFTIIAIIFSMSFNLQAYAFESEDVLNDGIGDIMLCGGSNYTSGTIDGVTVSGSISTNSTSATANTVYTNPGGKRIAVAYVYYSNEGKYYQASATNSSSQSGGVSATATKTISTATVVGGQGIHSLSYNAYAWNDYTSIGLIPAKIENK